MTVVLVKQRKQYIGLSTDAKPTLAIVDVGSSFYEYDTGDSYVWTDAGWVLTP